MLALCMQRVRMIKLPFNELLKKKYAFFVEIWSKRCIFVKAPNIFAKS